LGEFFPELRIACLLPSSKQRRKVSRTRLQGGETLLAFLILFSYNPENSISFAARYFNETDILWRRCAERPAGDERRGGSGGVYTNSGLICPIKEDPVTIAERNGGYDKHRFENLPMVFANERDSSSPLSSFPDLFLPSFFRLRV